MIGTPEPDVDAIVTAAFRDEWGRLVASLISMTRDWDLAEECAQDAFVQALQRWRRDGVPARPGGWLMTVARNRAYDRLRRGAVEATKLKQAAEEPPPATPEDERSGIPTTGSSSSSPAAIRLCPWRPGSP